MYRLIHLQNDRILNQYELSKDRYTLGRGNDNDLVFDADKVSRYHAVLVLEDDTYRIEDHSSANRVFVNNEQVTDRILVSGDVINLSWEVTLLFVDHVQRDDKPSRVLMDLVQEFSHKGLFRLRDVTKRIISVDRLANILEVILQEFMSLANAERGFIALVKRSGELDLEQSVNKGIELVPAWSEKGGSCARSIVNEALSAPEPVVVRASSDETQLSRSFGNLRLRAAMCVALRFGERVNGVIYVDSGTEFDEFNELDRFLYTLLADHAAIAIENAKLWEQTHKSVRQLERDVAASEDRYRQLVELSADMIAVVRDGTIVFANPAAESLLGASSAGAVVGLPLQRLVHPESRQLSRECISREIEQGRLPRRFCDRFRKLDGGYIDLEMMTGPLEFDGQPATLVIAHDVTEQLKLEAVVNRTQKLESLGVLAGGIAHDFNNILSAISSNVSLAQVMSENDEELAGILTDAQKAVKQATRLTQQLLTFSRGGEPVRRPQPLSDLVESATRFALRGSNVGSSFEFEECPLVDIDEGQVSQVLHNLVINAAQAMSDGGVLVLRVAPVKVGGEQSLPLPVGQYVVVSVIDTGGGISEDNLPLIFDPFFTTKRGGSGLGLATSHSIVSKHDGCITVESTLRQGTIVRVYLPATKKRQVTPSIEQGLSKPEGRGRVLLMEDNPNLRSVMRRMLDYLGYQVVDTEEGEQAVEVFRQELEANTPFDLVIMDLTVPGGMGGVEAAREIRKLAPDARTIVSSGYSNDPVISNPKAYGFDGVLAKPSTLSDLGAVLSEVLGRG